MKNLIAGALAMAVLGLSGRSAGQAVEAPAVDAPVQDESESKDGGEPLLPEAAKSSLLWTLRTCHALLGIKPLRAREVRTCMAKAAEMLSRDPDDALKDARVGLLSVLSSSVEEKNAQHVARELVDKVDALRKAAGALRAKQDSSIVLISQGGVSLGSWQAGLLYLVSERLKQKPGRAPRDPVFPTITGASAGAVNSLISASASCENPVKRPEDSLFYKIWIELGLVGRHGSPGLLGESAETLALFDKKALAFAMKQATEHFEDTKRYADGPCEVQIGLTLTHLDDNELPVHQNVTGQTVITGPTLREQFALKLQFEKPSSGSERRSVLTARNVGAQRVSGSFLEPASTPSNRFPVLGEGRTADASVPTELVLDAVRASGAFPAAFPPVSLPFARLNAAGTVGETKRARFIDGGVFDNTPVGLAIELEEMRKQALPAPPQPSLAQAMVPEPPTTYLLIEPSAISWSLGNKDKANELESSNRGIVETYASFASRFIGSSRSAALVETIRRWPFLAVDDNSGLQSRLTAPRRHMPIAGEQLGAFLGFLERDFRVFDFYVGMADATVLLGGDQCFAGSMGPPPVWSDLVTSPEFTCMQAYYSKTLATRTRIRTGDLPTTCRSLGSAERKRIDGEIDLSALRAELSEKDEERARRSDAEIAVTASNFRALLVASHNYRLWTESDARGIPGANHYDPGYTESLQFDVFFDELVKAGYTFLDLPRAPGGGAVSNSFEARRAVRQLMQHGIEQLAAEQPGDATNYAGIHVLGRAVADQYHLLRPNVFLGLGLAAQGVEGVLGIRLSDYFRWDTGVRVFRFDWTTAQANDSFLRFDSSLYTQLTSVLPAGSVADIELGAGFAGSLTHASSHGFLAARRLGVRASAGPVFLQRIYLVGDLEYFPEVVIDRPFNRYDIPIVRDWRWGISAGFRFLW